MPFPRFGLLVAAFVTLVGCTGTVPTKVAAPLQCPVVPPVVVVTRHAEKANDDPDTLLSERGRARAERLARLTKPMGASRVFATEARRTQQTVGPLAEALGIRVEVRPAKDVESLARELLALPSGTVAVVAHHSNTVPKLTHALGADVPGLEGGNLAHSAFGRVFIVVLGCGERKSTLLELDTDTAPEPDTKPTDVH
jgi:broad specificity phosphatase PhoE